MNLSVTLTPPVHLIILISALQRQITCHFEQSDTVIAGTAASKTIADSSSMAGSTAEAFTHNDYEQQSKHTCIIALFNLLSPTWLNPVNIITIKCHIPNNKCSTYL